MTAHPTTEPTAVPPRPAGRHAAPTARHAEPEIGRAERSLSGSLRLGQLYVAAPLAMAGTVLVVLAVVRILGAYDDVLMVASIVLTPAILLIVPRGLVHDVGLTPIGSRRVLARGVGGVLAAYVVVIVTMTAAFGTGPDNWTSGIDDLFTEMIPGHKALAIALAVMCMGVLIPLAEEVCFRGVLHHAIACRTGDGVAILGTAAIWAVLHLGDYGLNPLAPAVIAGMLPSVLLMGVALGWCRVITGSVVGSIVAQGIANLMLLGWVLSV